VIIRLPDTVASVSRIPYYILVGATVLSGLSLFVYIVPSLTLTVASWYTMEVGEYVQSLHGIIGIHRTQGAGVFWYCNCSSYCVRTTHRPRCLIHDEAGFYAMLPGHRLYSCRRVPQRSPVADGGTGDRRLVASALAAIGVGWIRRARLLLALLTFGKAILTVCPRRSSGRSRFLPGQCVRGSSSRMAERKYYVAIRALETSD